MELALSLLTLLYTDARFNSSVSECVSLIQLLSLYRIDRVVIIDSVFDRK